MAVQVLDVSTVPAYLASRADLADLIDATTAEVVEVGDGNLNLVFIATDAQGRSLVIKQSLPYVRLVGESWPLSQDRILAEARAYDAAVRLSPDTVPAYHGLDRENRLIVVEDLSSWTVWRRALNDGIMSPGAAAAMGGHVARIAFGTSVFGLPPEQVKAAIAASVNPDLCQITEDLVFTEPYVDHEHNSWDDEITPDVLALRDPAHLAHVSALKYRFVTAAQALVHGDLHTGSIFVPPAPDGKPQPLAPAAKAFDMEFCFYGPVGFDLGALFGNVLIAQCRARVLGRPAGFQQWLASLVDEAWTAFEVQVRALWPQRVDRSYGPEFLEGWLREVWTDAVGFGGCKATRRIVGLAKVSDIQTLPDAERVVAARAALRAAARWIDRRHEIAGPADLARLTDGLLPAGPGTTGDAGASR